VARALSWQTPKGVIDLGTYTNLALRMDIKNDGCDIGKKATVSNSKVTCTDDTGKSYRTYSSALRTDDPATSNHLFVDGKQVPLGVTASLEKYFGCTKTQNHAWEDGGGWERQDFFYTVTATCAPDGTYVPPDKNNRLYPYDFIARSGIPERAFRRCL
jgi:hypothetical protein